MGLQQDPPTTRKRRLMELVEIVTRLLAGETVTTAGEFFEIAEAHIAEAETSVPILVGGNGAALLEHAGSMPMQSDCRALDAPSRTGTGTRCGGHLSISNANSIRSVEEPGIDSTRLS